ncbi:MAG: leucine-rich repeat domain-containing protein [Patescibacteria group bacterium]|jgi:Leucine-rich repeat (LRR) protein
MNKNIALLVMAAALVLVGAGCGKTTTMISGDQAASRDQVVRTAAFLDLSNQGLTKVPADVFGRTGLEVLDLSNNRLTGAIPAEIRLLQKLKTLNLSNNEMTGLPAEVGQLRDLEVLDLSNNQLTGLPNELRNLSKLRTLNLAGNPYSAADLEYIRQGLPNAVIIIK